MSDGIRPKGCKSYAATRSPEAAEAFRKDHEVQKTLDTADKKHCPKCGSEMDEVSRFPMRFPRKPVGNCTGGSP